MTSLFSITTELLTHKSEAQFRVAPCEQSRKGRTLTGADFGSFDTQTFLASDYNVVGRVFQYKNCSKAETNIFSPLLLFCFHYQINIRICVRGQQTNHTIMHRIVRVAADVQ